MPDELIAESKGITVELWQDTKGTRGRIKVNFMDIEEVKIKTQELTKWLKEMYNIELRG